MAPAIVLTVGHDPLADEGITYASRLAHVGIGLGGVGMAALIAAVADGAGDVIAVDNVAEKLQLARELGAVAAYTPAEVAEQGIRVSHVLDCAGHPRAFETAFAATAPGGRTVTVGLPDPTALAAISPLTITAQARTIVGSYLGSAVPARDIPRFVQWWREGRLPIERLITRRIRLEEINHAMDELAAGRAVRQVINFDEQGAIAERNSLLEVERWARDSVVPDPFASNTCERAIAPDERGLRDRFSARSPCRGRSHLVVRRRRLLRRQ